MSKDNEYKLTQEDAGKILEIEQEGANHKFDIIVPNNNTENIQEGSEIKVYRAGSARTEFVPEDNNVKIISPKKEIYSPTFFIRKYGQAQIRKRALNEWVLSGDLIYYSLFAEGGDEVFIEEDFYGFLYRVHVFSTVGENEFRVLNGSGKIDLLLVGGGGAGGTTDVSTAIGAGGGGAGGLIYKSNYDISTGNYIFKIGSGGIPTTGVDNGENGGDTNAFGLTAIGGGGGGNRDSQSGGANGGSGGGSAYNSGGEEEPGQEIQPESSDEGFGNRGGYGAASGSSYGSGGGGGGAISVGSNTSGASENVNLGQSNGDGSGGTSMNFNITMKTAFYAGGGGGGGGRDDDEEAVFPGGFESGGKGGDFSTEGFGENGVDGTGGGGGGGGSSSRFGSNRLGGRGGSGVVIVRYLIRQDEV